MKKETANLPQIVDFSKEAVDKAVLKHTLMHNVTIWPVAFGSLGVLAAFFIWSGMLFFSLGVCTLGLGGWIVNYCFRSEAFANKYISMMRERLESNKALVLATLQKDLESYTDLEGAGHFARQGVEQFTRIQDKFQKLQSVLASKLNVNEITYGRYYCTAEQVSLSVLDNLKDISDLLKGVASIDLRYIRSRLEYLEGLVEPEEADLEEIETLTKRKNLRQASFKRINILLTHNEKAMTEIDETTFALSQIRTIEGRATMDMETARKQLEELAGRANRYSIEA